MPLYNEIFSGELMGVVYSLRMCIMQHTWHSRWIAASLSGLKLVHCMLSAFQL